MPNGHDVHFALNPKMGCRGVNIAAPPQLDLYQRAEYDVLEDNSGASPGSGDA